MSDARPLRSPVTLPESAPSALKRRVDRDMSRLQVRLLLLALLSSVLLPLALPNELFGAVAKFLGVRPSESLYWGNAVLALVCIAPVFYAVTLAPTFGFAALMGVVFGGISTALSSFWLMFFQNFSVWTYGGVIIGYIGYNALLFPFLRGVSRISVRYRPFLLAIAWCVYEYLKSIGFLAYPWGLVANPAINFLPLVQFADVTGVWGVSFLMALVNALAAELALSGWRLPFRRQMAFVVVLVACALGYGVYKMETPIPHTSTASLLLVQQNMNPWAEGGGVADSITVNADLTLQGVKAPGKKPDLAVWSESSVSTVGVYPDGRYYPTGTKLVPLIQRAGIPVLFGGIGIADQDKGLYYNSSVLVAGDGKVVDTYAKMHLVPFAESIPLFDESKGVHWFFTRVIHVWNSWVPGNRYTIFRVPVAEGGQMTFATPICFEDAFADLCRQYIRRGADILLNLTDDSWSDTWSAEIQHFQVAQFRAIENRRVLVRSANGGVSGVVGPWGDIEAKMPFFERVWKKVEVPVYKESNLTLYTRFGDWFPQALGFLLLVVLVVNVVPKKRRLPSSDSLGGRYYYPPSGFTR
jgi:apolipoprotein N-acyltransferase